MDLSSLVAFVVAGLLLNLTPGPDVLYIVGHSLRGGARAGAVAALGITAGCFVHIMAGAAGLTALLAASPQAFAVLKWTGGAYLAWIGWGLLTRSPDVATKLIAWRPDSARAGTVFDIFVKGFLTNVLNPKVALFFLAFVPQFIGPQIEHKALAFLALGLLFNFNGLWVNLGWALAAAWLASQSGALRRRLAWLDRLAGAMFIAFGVRLALADNSST